MLINNLKLPYLTLICEAEACCDAYCTDVPLKTQPKLHE
jgi:hypothetical protein